MATFPGIIIVKRPLAQPKLPAYASSAGTPKRHLTTAQVGRLTEAMDIADRLTVAQPYATLSARKPWVEDRAELTVFNATFYIAGWPSLDFTPSSGAHLGSVQVRIANTSPGKMFVVEFVGRSQNGNDFKVENGGSTLTLPAGDFSLPIAVSASSAEAYCRISAANYQGPRISQSASIHSVKVWKVN